MKRKGEWMEYGRSDGEVKGGGSDGGKRKGK